MRKLILSLVITCCLAATVHSNLIAQDKGQAAPDMAEMMKKWKEASSPNEHHKSFAGMVGKWNTENTMWMAPGAPPMVSKGTAEISLILDGRFLKQEAKGEFMGGPYSGSGLTGYDNMKKCYVMTWVDNTASGISSAEGNYDMSGKVLTLYGKMDEPTTGEHDKNVKYVLRKIDDDKFVFEVHDLVIGEPNTKVMEITYTRAK